MVWLTIVFYAFICFYTGLISRVIAHSGSAIAPWAITRDPRKSAKIAATEIGCEAPTTYEMVNCLRQVCFNKPPHKKITLC